MSKEESVELLLQSPASTPKENSEGIEVAATLGHLALALDQAGAYIRSRGLPLNQFVAHYQKRKKAVLEEVPDEYLRPCTLMLRYLLSFYNGVRRVEM